MQAEEAVQVDSGVAGVGAGGLGDGDAGAQLIISRLTERDHDVETVRRPALENRDKNFFALRRGSVRISGARQPGRGRADAEHRQARALEKRSSTKHTYLL